MSKLLFVDTNIYLDFYRIRNDVKTEFLSNMEAISDKLIVTEQIEMEFKKNRQKAILEGMKELKAPEKISVPGVLRRDKSTHAINSNIEDINFRISKLKTRLENVLGNPSRYDKVYQVAQRLFGKRMDIDLYRKSKKRLEIRELAKKRYILGYPPRKKGDTCISDAINWEWLVEIAKLKNMDIWIVSRDEDYGVIYHHNNKGFLNDWLKQEFRERVHKKRRIVLEPLLSRALKEFESPVTIEAQQEEEKIAEEKTRDVVLAVDSAFISHSADHVDILK